jgi:hypothetical protein
MVNLKMKLDGANSFAFCFEGVQSIFSFPSGLSDLPFSLETLRPLGDFSLKSWICEERKIS